MATTSSSSTSQSASESTSQPPATIEAESGVEAPPPSPVQPPRQVDATLVNTAAADSPLPVNTTTADATSKSAAPCTVAHENGAGVHPDLANTRHNSSHSIADDLSYPSDVRQNPALNHRRNAFTLGDTPAPSAPSQSAPRKPSPKPESSHKRGISSTNDFAYPAGDARQHIRSPSEEEQLNQFRKANGDSLLSRQTTAVNTYRNSSDASGNEAVLDHLVDGLDPALYEGLSRVVAAAQPGVTVRLTFNVHKGSTPKGQMEVHKPRESKKEEGRAPSGRKSLVMEVIDDLKTMCQTIGYVGTVIVIIAFVRLCLTAIGHVLEHFYPFAKRQSTGSFRNLPDDFFTEINRSSSPGSCLVPRPFQEAISTIEAHQMCALKEISAWSWWAYFRASVVFLFVVGSACYMVHVLGQRMKVYERDRKLRQQIVESVEEMCREEAEMRTN